jgi:hypothetical protein
MLALYVIGVGFALMYRKRYPKAAWLALGGLGALVLDQAIGFWMHFFVDLEPSAQDVRAVARTLATIIWIRYGLSLVGSALLISAVFAGRNATKVPADA